MEDENSWLTNTPTLEHRKRPAVFEPKDVTPVSRRAFGGAGDAGIYTRAQLSEFWDNILISAASRTICENSRQKSSSPTQQFMDQNNTPIMLRDRTFMWTS